MCHNLEHKVRAWELVSDFFFAECVFMCVCVGPLGGGVQCGAQFK